MRLGEIALRRDRLLIKGDGVINGAELHGKRAGKGCDVGQLWGKAQELAASVERGRVVSRPILRHRLLPEHGHQGGRCRARCRNAARLLPLVHPLYCFLPPPKMPCSASPTPPGADLSRSPAPLPPPFSSSPAPCAPPFRSFEGSPTMPARSGA